MPIDDIRKKNHSYRSKLIRQAIIIVSCGVLLTVGSLLFYRNVNHEFNVYINEKIAVYSHQEQLLQRLGYGGFIHNFKNLVLRKDIAKYEPLLREDFRYIYKTLRSLEYADEYGIDAFKELLATVQTYEQQLNLLVELIQNGATSEEIDRVVKVDDTLALKALSQFEGKIRAQSHIRKQALSQQFRLAFIIQVLTFLLFVGVLLVYMWNLLQKANNEHLLLEKALAGSQAKTDFLANMSHEIRTPLNGIMGVLQVLQRKHIATNDKNLIDKALYSTQGLMQLLNDILDQEKIEANALTLESIDFSITPLLEAIESDFSAQAKQKSIAFTLEQSADFPPVWHGDPVRLRQILLNLISNAIKFTETGGVHVKLTTTQKAETSGMTIEVSDTGIGMTAQQIESLFSRFIQADVSITRKYGGSGLGMSITKHLVELMKGEIKVRSTPGVGTNLTVYLPLMIGDEDSTQTMSELNVATPDLSSAKILIAEDNTINQDILDAMLKPTHARYVFVDNGKDAIAACKRIHPDLILMDIQMPEMDGVEACLAIRNIDSEIPVIALTANVFDDDIRRYLDVGFNCHIPKPVDMNVLYSELSRYLA